MQSETPHFSLVKNPKGLSMLIFCTLLWIFYFVSMAPGWTGDEASIWITHIRYGPIFSAYFFSNHPLYLVIAASFHELGFPNELSLRLPSLLASLFLFWGMANFTFKKFGIGLPFIFLILFFGILPAWASYSFFGKSYVLVSLFLFALMYCAENKNSKSWMFGLAAFLGMWSSPSFLFILPGLGISIFLNREIEKSRKRKIALALLCGFVFALFLMFLSWLKSGGEYFSGNTIGNFPMLSLADRPQAMFNLLLALFHQASPVIGNEIPIVINYVAGAAFYFIPLVYVLSKKLVLDSFSKMIFWIEGMAFLLILLTGFFPPERFFLFTMPLQLFWMASLLPKRQVRLMHLIPVCLLIFFLLVWNLKTHSQEREFPDRANHEIENAANFILTKQNIGTGLVFHDWDEEGLFSYYFFQAGGDPHGIKVDSEFGPGIHLIKKAAGIDSLELLYSGDLYAWGLRK